MTPSQLKSAGWLPDPNGLPDIYWKGNYWLLNRHLSGKVTIYKGQVSTGNVVYNVPCESVEELGELMDKLKSKKHKHGKKH